MAQIVDALSYLHYEAIKSNTSKNNAQDKKVYQGNSLKFELLNNI
jgi:hypothetical protein